MSDKKRKRSVNEQLQAHLHKLEQAKKKLSKLQQQRKLEIGALACKYGLDQLDNSDLETVFQKLSKEQPSS